MSGNVSKPGKGSNRRGGAEEARKYRENWEVIFGKPKKQNTKKGK